MATDMLGDVRPSYPGLASVLGCSVRHVAALVASGRLTKGNTLQGYVAEWTAYQRQRRRNGR